MIALDASALLAFLLRERGHERVRELLSEACMLPIEIETIRYRHPDSGRGLNRVPFGAWPARD